MNALVAFLTARLDEDEAKAKAWLPDEHTAGQDPDRVLREVAAKRALLSYFTDPATGEPVTLLVGESAVKLALQTGTILPGSWVLRELAAVYSYHPDYQAEWTL